LYWKKGGIEKGRSGDGVEGEKTIGKCIIEPNNQLNP